MILFSQTSDATATITLRGEVIGECPEIPSGLERLDVFIDSFGGDFYLGLDLYRAIREAKPKASFAHVATAMSAATMPMCACDLIEMSSDSIVMIHGVTAVGVSVNAEEAERLGRELTAMNTQLVGIYCDASGASSDVVRGMVTAETYMDAEAMAKLGFNVVKVDKRKAKRKSAEAHDIAVRASAEFARRWRNNMTIENEQKPEEECQNAEPASEPVPAPVPLTEERVREIVQEMLSAQNNAEEEKNSDDDEGNENGECAPLPEEEEKPELDAVVEAVTAERRRISAINGYSSVATSDVIAKAIDEGTSVEAFAMSVLDGLKMTAEAKRKAVLASAPVEPVQAVATSTKPEAKADANTIMKKIFG